MGTSRNPLVHVLAADDDAFAEHRFSTLCSVLASVALLVLLAKVPDKTEQQDPAKYMMIRLGLAGRLPLLM